LNLYLRMLNLSKYNIGSVSPHDYYSTVVARYEDEILIAKKKINMRSRFR